MFRITVAVPLVGVAPVTLNNDGRHDFLRIENIEAYPGNKIFIYTKLGKKVFELENYSNNDSGRRFEGYSNVGGNDALADGTYYYVVQYNLITNNETKRISGYIVISQ